MITVKQLIEKLKKMPQDAAVVTRSAHHSYNDINWLHLYDAQCHTYGFDRSYSRYDEGMGKAEDPVIKVVVIE